MKISKIEETPIKPYFSGIAMNKLEWKARIDDTDVAKQESKVDKKEKRKVQRKSRTKKKSEGRAHPGQKKRQHQRECSALIRDFGNILPYATGCEVASTGEITCKRFDFTSLGEI